MKLLMLLPFRLLRQVLIGNLKFLTAVFVLSQEIKKHILYFSGYAVFTYQITNDIFVWRYFENDFTSNESWIFLKESNCKKSFGFFVRPANAMGVMNDR